MIVEGEGLGDGGRSSGGGAQDIIYNSSKYAITQGERLTNIEKPLLLGSIWGN